MVFSVVLIPKKLINDSKIYSSCNHKKCYIFLFCWLCLVDRSCNVQAEVFTVKMMKDSLNQLKNKSIHHDDGYNNDKIGIVNDGNLIDQWHDDDDDDDIRVW